MSLELFQKIDEETIGILNVKRDFIRIHHQQETQLKHTDQNIDFISGQINNDHQIGNAYIQYGIAAQKYSCYPWKS